MATFGRTIRQNAMGLRFNAIREIGDMGLLSPTEGEYGDDELAEEWDELVVGYREIHTENGTIG